MKAHVTTITPAITMTVGLADLTKDDKRHLFQALLRDKDVSCGTISESEAREFYELLDRYCAWSGQDKARRIDRATLIEGCRLGAEYAAMYTGNGVVYDKDFTKFPKPLRAGQNDEVDAELTAKYLRGLSREAQS